MKIPGNCKVCGNALSEFDMSYYLELCERNDHDPMRACRTSPPGILCSSCVARTLMDDIEDEEETAIEWLGAVKRHMGVGQTKH